MASAQVKSAILFAGLVGRRRDRGARAGADPGPHRGDAGRRRRRHHASSREGGPGGDPGPARRRSSRLDVDVPGDPSQAAFWVVAACVVPGSAVVVEGVYGGAARIGFVRRARADGRRRRRPAGLGRRGRDAHRAGTGRCAATVVEAAEIPSLDEVPVLAVAAAAATGTTTVP